MKSYPLTPDEMKIIRMALADRVSQLDKVIKMFPNVPISEVVAKRAETQALRDKLLNVARAPH